MRRHFHLKVDFAAVLWAKKKTKMRCGRNTSVKKHGTKHFVITVRNVIENSNMQFGNYDIGS